MKIVSIEPTPSPNSMKLNMDERLPEGTTYNFNQGNKADAPQYIQQLLAVDGVKGIFQVQDFIAVERHPKHDWKVVLADIRQLLGEANAEQETDKTIDSDKLSGAEQEHSTQSAKETASFGEVNVLIQMLKGVPMQVKLTTPDEEKRFGLPDRFKEAIMKVQETASNLILDREWVEQGVRYGDMDDIGETIVEEINAAYDEERVDRLVAKAFKQDVEEEVELSHDEILKQLDDPDWKVRYAAIERLELTEDDLPILQKAIHDEKVSIRRLATAYLGEIGGKKALPILYKVLKDSSAAVRRTAGDALSDIGDVEATPVMIEALKDKNKLVRWRAARFLYEVGDDSALEALKGVVDDPEFEVSLQAQMAIERIEKGEEAEGTVWQQMTRDLNPHSGNNR